MLMRKNVIYTTEKQNMTSDFVSVCCCIKNEQNYIDFHQKPPEVSLKSYLQARVDESAG